MPEIVDWKPMDVSALDLAFPANVMHMMPAHDAIPAEFSRSGNKWNRLFNDWFFQGLSSLEVVAKEGIDKDRGLRHISVVMRSFEPKHEHKEAACAYLMSLWFDDATYEVAKRKGNQ